MATIYYPSTAVVYTRTVVGQSLTEQFIGVAPDNIFVLSGSTLFTSSLSASWASQSLSSSFATTAAFALNAAGTGLVTGSSYPITSSWATNVVNAGTTLVTGGLYQITASWSVNAGTTLITASTYPITSSWSVSSSFASTANNVNTILPAFTVVTLLTGSNNDVTMSFTGSVYQQINLTTAFGTSKPYQFTASNPPTSGGSHIYLYINNTAVGTSSIAFPTGSTGWKSLSGGWPTQITSSKIALVELWFFPGGNIVGQFAAEI